MNKATQLTLNGRDKVSDRPNCSANLAYTVHAREPGEMVDWSNSFKCSTSSPARDAVAPVLVGGPHETLSA